MDKSKILDKYFFILFFLLLIEFLFGVQFYLILLNLQSKTESIFIFCNLILSKYRMINFMGKKELKDLLSLLEPFF